MRAHPKFLAFAVALSASATAIAQVPEEGEPRAGQSRDAGGYPSYPNERHVFVRAVGGAGLQFNNAWGQGLLASVYPQAHVGFLFLNAGRVHLGFELGGAIGFLPGHAPPQYTVNPGVAGMVRFSPLLGLTFRLDVPLLITRGATQYTRIQAVNPALNTGASVFAPVGRGYTVGFGFEAGVGLALYLTSGIALTAEISPSLYFGDAFFTYPGVAASLGVLIDYEVLP